MNRRSLLGSIIFASATLNFPVNWVTSARAEQKNWRHGLSLFGELKYPPDFKHFDSPAAWHGHLLEAARLFKTAGYEVRRRKLVNSKTGRPCAVELLSDDPNFEHVFLFYRPALQRLGITVTVRTVDSTQYENRLRTRDFDIVVMTQEETLSPGNEQHGFWGSQAADQPGSLNLIGIKKSFSQRAVPISKLPHGRSIEYYCGTTSGAAMDLRKSAYRSMGPL